VTTPCIGYYEIINSDGAKVAPHSVLVAIPHKIVFTNIQILLSKRESMENNVIKFILSHKHQILGLPVSKNISIGLDNISPKIGRRLLKIGILLSYIYN